MERGLFIQLFGSAELLVDGVPVTTKLSAKSLAILCFLVCHEQRRASREKLASMLWSESYETATYNLRYNLWNIKKVIPPDENGAEFLLTSKDCCSINPDYHFRSDLIRLEQLLAIPSQEQDLDHLLELKSLLSKELMEEFYIRDSGEFNDWLLFERTRYQKLSLQVLEQLYEAYTAAGDLAGAESSLQALLRISPYEEDYYLRLIRLHLSRGERHGAIQAYRRCEELLRKDLNLPPSRPLRELYLSLSASAAEQGDGSSPLREINVSHSVWPGGQQVEGAVLADVLELVLSRCDRGTVAKIPKVFLLALSTICPSLIPAYGLDCPYQQVSQVRLLHSLRGFFSQLSRSCRFHITLESGQWIDPLSLRALHYLCRCCPEGFCVSGLPVEQDV